MGARFFRNKTFSGISKSKEKGSNPKKKGTKLKNKGTNLKEERTTLTKLQARGEGEVAPLDPPPCGSPWLGYDVIAQ